MPRQNLLFSHPRSPKRPAIEEQIEAAGLPEPETEVMFHPTRKWRLDYAWPSRRIALEVEGMPFGRMVDTVDGQRVRTAGGRHSTGAGLSADCEKYSWAAILGWCVVRVTPPMIRDGSGIELLKEAFRMRGLVAQ